jgi:hypothetical protein
MATLAQILANAGWQDPDVDGPLIRKAPKGRMDDAYAPWDEVYHPEDGRQVSDQVYRQTTVDGMPFPNDFYRDSPASLSDLLQRWLAYRASIRPVLPPT